MNFLGLAIAAGKLARSSHLSRRRNLLILYPISSSLYSSSASTTKQAWKKPRTQPQHPPFPKSEDSPMPRTQPQPQPPPSPKSEDWPRPRTQPQHPPFPKSEEWPWPRTQPQPQPPPSPKSEDWPRPGEIPWQIKVANSVNLIGHLQIPVQFQASPDGKYFAGTVIAQKLERSSDSPPFFWIPIIFEGDLAHIAACHLKKDDFVHISGQLSVDPPPFTLAGGQANVQVMVDSVSYVDAPPRKSFVPPKQEEPPVNRPVSESEEISVDESLKDLIAKRHKQWDISMKKGNSTSAFEYKENGKLIQIDESTPEWILKKAELLKFDCKSDQQTVKGASTVKDVENSWRDLLKNSKDWYDHRERKRNGLVKAKHPDFKHKKTGISLWLSSAPQFVLPGLEGLEFDAPPTTTKPQPNDKKEPELDEDPWKNLVENPGKWWDNRLNKFNVKSPDFKHKDTGKVLWLSDTPTWALSKLPPSKS